LECWGDPSTPKPSANLNDVLGFYRPGRWPEKKYQ